MSDSEDSEQGVKPLEPLEMNCGLCEDTQGLEMYAKCHPTAPLRARFEGSDGLLVLSCYVPECSREVVRMFVTHGPKRTTPGGTQGD